MPIQIQLPASVSTPAQWGVTGSDPSCVQTNDGDTTGIFASNQNLEHLYLMDAFPAGVVSPVISCSAHIVARTPSGDAGAYNLWNGSTYTGNHVLSGIYLDWSVAYYSLVKADISAGKCGVKSPSAGTVSGGVTMIYRSVEYRLSVGGLIFLLGGLVGAAVGLGELAGLAREVNARTRVLIRPDEFLWAYRALKEYQHTVYFLP